MTEIFESTGQSLLYGVVGLVVMAVGFIALDLVTPGKLYHVVWTDRNRGAAVLLGSPSVRAMPKTQVCVPLAETVRSR